MAFDPNADAGPVNQTTPTATPTAPTSGNSNAWLQQLAAALAATGGALGGRAIANASGNPLTQAVPPQLSQLLDNSVARQGYQNPLFQATTQGAYGMLPTFAKNGIAPASGSLPSVLPPAAPSASGSSGPGLGTAAGISGLAALMGLLGKGGGNSSGGNLSDIIKKIRDLFAKKGFGNYQGIANVQPSYDPFNSNNDWNGITPDQNGRNGAWPDNSPSPNVNTDEFLGQWPETSDPFAPFDPSQLGDNAGGTPDPWGP